jgi:4-diphosphocytidyl-2-C-methyl-D-erythritol kinase
LFDQIEVHLAPSTDTRITVDADCPDVPDGAQNLTARAATAFHRRTGTGFELSVRLRKGIPTGSGLGGGSSDAAAILHFLNKNWESRLPIDALAAIGAEIGADVPFFVYGRPAVVEGIGETVSCLPPNQVHPLHLVIAFSGVMLSTSLVFDEFDRITRQQPASSLTRSGAERNIPPLAETRIPLPCLLVNDLEEAAMRVCPQVASLKQAMTRFGADKCSMTGSGSAVFGVCADAERARRVALNLQREGCQAWAVETLAEAPRA